MFIQEDKCQIYITDKHIEMYKVMCLDLCLSKYKMSLDEI